MVEHTVVNLCTTDNKSIEDDVSQWTPEKVKEWFHHNGFKKYESAAIGTTHHPINGKILLSLNLDDLQQAPFLINNMLEADHLLSCIEVLRKSQLTKYMEKLEKNGIRNGFYSNTLKQSNTNGLTPNGHAYTNSLMKTCDGLTYSSITNPLLPGEENLRNGSVHPCSEQYPSEKLKNFLALLYWLLGFMASVVMLQFVHERVPAMDVDPPLPDVFFDIVPSRMEGAFSICEFVGVVLTIFCGLIFIFHKHRFIIARRVFFIMGTLYLYRSCTMFVTTLPVPGLHFRCAPKAGGKLSVMLGRATHLFVGGGLSMTGSHHLCGDYLFSGHTIVLTVTYLVIHEYTPKRLWWFHWICWFLSAIGIFCILLAHDHYTIDVIVAYLLTTRLFWSYHTLCNFKVLQDASNSNLLSRAWWFPILRYFEANVPSNKQNSLPVQYEFPFVLPRFLHSGIGAVRKATVKGV